MNPTDNSAPQAPQMPMPQAPVQPMAAPMQMQGMPKKNFFQNPKNLIFLGVGALVIVAGIIATVVIVTMNSPKVTKDQVNYLKAVGTTFNNVVNSTKDKLGAVDTSSLTLDNLANVADAVDKATKYNDEQTNTLPYYSGTETKALDDKYRSFKSDLNDYIKDAGTMIQYGTALSAYGDYLKSIANLTPTDYGSSSKVFDVSDRLFKIYNPISSKMYGFYSNNKKLDDVYGKTTQMMKDVEDELDAMGTDIRNAYYDKQDSQVGGIITTHLLKISNIFKKFSDEQVPALQTIADELKSNVKDKMQAFIDEYNKDVKDYNVKDVPTLVSVDLTK